MGTGSSVTLSQCLPCCPRTRRSQIGRMPPPSRRDHPPDGEDETGLTSEAEAKVRAAKARAAIACTRATKKHLDVISSILSENGANEVDVMEVSATTVRHLSLHTGHENTGLVVYVKGCAIGGLEDLKRLSEGGALSEWFKDHQYDLIVIGGGSGGLAAAKEAANQGWKVACLDFVKPTPNGTTWGLGGTCVNVGCIPKKLMHQAALLGHSIKDAKAFGWKIPPGEVEHNWKTLRQNVQDHIAGLNWGYKVQLREKTVTYVNGFGVFTGSHEITATDKKGKEEKLTADRFLISTGLRPKYPDIPGAKEFCITSDDLFSLKYPPGKTLCVGASYVSLECAGFLHGFGNDVTVMVRSILLRGFDQDMANRIKRQMVEEGVKFVNAVPTRVEELEKRTATEAGRLRVFWNVKGEDDKEVEVSDEFNTVLLAIGREAVTDDLHLEIPGAKRDSKTLKVIGRHEQSVSCPFVFAVGDVLEGGLELTPVAIQAGKMLIKRLATGKGALMDYEHVPTTVFTPLEYGCCGLAEETALARYGAEEVIVYHNVFLPLEYTVPDRKEKEHCYCKLICRKTAAGEERVVGFHILCPSAGEVSQGFGMALKLRATKEHFDSLVGIHPTVAENFTTLTLVKKEGEDELKASGC